MGLERIVKKCWEYAGKLGKYSIILGVTAGVLNMLGGAVIFNHYDNKLDELLIGKKTKEHCEGDWIYFQRKNGASAKVQVKDDSLNVFFKDNEVKVPYNHNPFSFELSPEGDKLAIFLLNNNSFKLLIADNNGSLKDFSKGEYKSIEGWGDDGILRMKNQRFLNKTPFQDITLYDINYDSNNSEKVFDGRSISNLSTGFGFFGSSLIFLGAAITMTSLGRRYTQFSKASQCISDYLVAHPKFTGLIAGGLTSGFMFYRLGSDSYPQSFLNICAGLGIGSSIYSASSVCHALKSPMLLNFMRAYLINSSFNKKNGKEISETYNKIADLYEDNILKLKIKTKAAFFAGDIEDALYLQEKILSFKEKHLSLTDLNNMSENMFYFNLKKYRRLHKETNSLELSELYVSSLLGNKENVLRIIKDLFNKEDILADEKLVLAGLISAQFNQGESSQIWTSIIKRLENKYEFSRIGESRNKVMEITGSSLLKDTLIFKQCGEIASQEFNKTNFIFANHNSKYEVAKPIIYLPELNYAIYQRTKFEFCGDLGQIIERLSEFHKHVSESNIPDFIENFNYYDALEKYCFDRFPDSCHSYKDMLSKESGKVISTLKGERKVVHGDFTFNNFGKCTDPYGKEHICIWDFELLSRALPEMDAARLITHPTYKGDFEDAVDLIGKKMDTKMLLEHVRYDSMRLIGGCLMRGDKKTAGHYGGRLLQSSQMLGDEKFASGWRDMLADWTA